jgi:hypothetical protein
MSIAWEATPIASINAQNVPITWPWHFVCEIEDDWQALSFVATGRWSCLGDAVNPCEADGHPVLALPADQLLVPKCAPGTLIGKLGGSIAGRDDGTVFAIGSRAIVQLGDKKNDTFLYIGINGAVARAQHTLERLDLTVAGLLGT